MPKMIRLIDRTRTVTDWKCERARYWGYEYKGRGIMKAGLSIELFLGIVVHDALAAIGTLHLNDKTIPIDDIANAAYNQVYDQLIEKNEGLIQSEAIEWAKEQGSLTEGMIRGYYKHVWPRLLGMYPEVICVEQEMTYPLTEGVCKTCNDEGQVGDQVCPTCDGDIKQQFTFMTKPDLIMADHNEELVYIEYKTTSSKKDNWVKSWETAVQLHSSIKATEFSLGKLPSAVQIVGLYKGYESYGKQSSPFCYAYKKPGNPPFSDEQVQYEYKPGFKRYPTWELEGGVKQWVEDMPETILANQFPLTAPIMVNEDLIDSFFRQRLIREKQIASFDNDSQLDELFPQRFDQCQPYFGWACQYKKICHGFVQVPEEEGYTLREPHHDLEREQLGLELLEHD